MQDESESPEGSGPGQLTVCDTGSRPPVSALPTGSAIILLSLHALRALVLLHAPCSSCAGTTQLAIRSAAAARPP